MTTNVNRRRVLESDHKIYQALNNPSHITSIVDDNGVKQWLTPYKFIATLHRSIKKHKRYLSDAEAKVMITRYEMPAIQRCLQAVVMLNNENIDENDLHKYIARKFPHITTEMLKADHQTEEARIFKEKYDSQMENKYK